MGHTILQTPISDTWKYHLKRGRDVETLFLADDAILSRHPGSDVKLNFISNPTTTGPKP